MVTKLAETSWTKLNIKTLFRKMLRRMLMFVTVVMLLFDRNRSCPIAMQDGWKQMSLEERTKLSHVVAVGKAVEIYTYVSYARRRQTARFQLLDVLKGRNITDKINANTEDPLFKIFGFGSPVQCMSSVTKNETYLLFAILESKSMSLVAAYDTPFGATAKPTRTNQDRILASLGYGTWSDWSACSVSCAGGQQTRTRRCRVNKCDERLSEQRGCNNYDCKGVKDMLKPFKYGRNTRSIPPPPTHRNALRIASSGNLSVPTHAIFYKEFPRDFTMFASAKYISYTEGYLVSFYDSRDRLQIGIQINKTSVALDYVEVGTMNQSKSLAFNVEVVDQQWHQFAFSVRNGEVSFYLDCNKIGTKIFQRDGKSKVDTNGSVYLNRKTSQSQRYVNNLEFYIEELYLSDDGTAGEEQCVTINDPYGHRTEFSGSGDSGYSEDFEEPEFEWAGWTSCSHSCGKFGVRKRVKMCTNLPISHPECQAALQEQQIEACNRVKCPPRCQPQCVHGTCLESNKCYCQTGYGGTRCEKALPCEKKCINGGWCISFLKRCNCPKGFSGIHCEKANCDPPCKNGGTCIGPNICKCKPGYLQPHCTPICRPDCQNKGICIMPNRCRCPSGYTGPRCERAVCTKPCLHGGTCYKRNKCNCKSGWTGETCNVAICNPRCLNGGECRAPNRCVCPNATGGTYCQHVVCYPRCRNGGKCVLGNRCVCSYKYTGSQCQRPLCRTACKNGGKCVAPNQCMCPSGYFGNSCERRSCIYKTRVVPQKRTHLVPVTRKYRVRCPHLSGWRPCMVERTEYKTVHITTRRTIYYCT